MRISRHAVFDRYNIVSETNLTDAAEKLDRHLRHRRLDRDFSSAKRRRPDGSI